MSKIDLKNPNIYKTIVHTGIVLLLLMNFWATMLVSNKIDTAVTVVNSNIDNVYRKLDSFNQLAPEIPDEDNKEYQASCPPESDFLDDPDKVIAFMDALDPYVKADPWKLQFLGILLLGDMDSAKNYLEHEFTSGYPYQ